MNIKVIIFLAILIRVFLIVITPVNWDADKWGLQAHNDETSHVNYVRYLLINNELPVMEHNFQEEDAFLRNEFEYYQPPLEYLFMFSAAKLLGINVDGNSIVYLCRIISSLIGIISILALFKIAKVNFSTKAAQNIALIFAFMPVSLRHTSSFSNDNLVWLFAILLFGFILRRNGKKDFILKNSLLEGLLLGLAIFTKTTALTIFVFYVLMIILDKTHWKSWLIPAIIGIIIAMPYFIRNEILYGDFLATTIGNGPVQTALSEMTFGVWFHFLRGLIISFAFPFDTLNIPFLLRFPAYIFWISVAGLIIYSAFRNFTSQNILTIKNQFLLLAAISFLGMIYFNWNYNQTEFRIIFHCVPAIMLAFNEYFENLSLKKLIIISSAGLIYPFILLLVFM